MIITGANCYILYIPANEKVYTWYTIISELPNIVIIAKAASTAVLSVVCHRFFFCDLQYEATNTATHCYCTSLFFIFSRNSMLY